MDHLDYNFSRNLKTIEDLDFDNILHLNFNLDIEKNLATMVSLEGRGRVLGVQFAGVGGVVKEYMQNRMNKAQLTRLDKCDEIF